jgi:membrane associated rhomboid family serine protease
MARVNLPPLTRSLLITLISFTLLNAIIQPEYTAIGPFTRKGNGSPYLSIVPRWSWKYPWTVVTASFVEQNVFGLLVSGLTLFYGGRYLERAWSSAEYAKFILIVGVVPNILCFLVYIVFFEISGSGKALYGISIVRS